MMRVEFTKMLISNSFSDIKFAVNERLSNIKAEKLDDQSKKALETALNKPHLILGFEDIQLLTEMAAEVSKLWANGKTLKIYFFGGQNAITDKVMLFAKEWTEYCSIKFQVVENSSDANIRIAFRPPGSWSYIGTDVLGVPKDQATMNFGWLSHSLPDIDFKQVVLHEFGHALGLIHEHQSPVAKIKWNKTLVYRYFQDNYNWDQLMVDQNIFKEFESSSTQYSEIDPKSIMTYQIPSEFTTDGHTFPMNYELSEKDKQYISHIYPVKT